MIQHLCSGVFLTRAFLVSSTLILFLFNANTKADPCGVALTAVSPVEGSLYWTMKTGHEANAADHWKTGKGEGGEDTADAQVTAHEAARVAEEGAIYNETSVPMFAAAIPIALAKGMFVQMVILQMCVGKRSAQGGAQRAAEAANDAVAQKTTQEDKVNGTLVQLADAVQTGPNAVAFSPEK